MDRGPLPAAERAKPISVTIALALPGLSEAEKLREAIYTPGNPEYRHFLSSADFNARFGPTDADVANAAAALGRYGLSVERTTATMLRVTGLPADLERAFSVNLHRYEAAGHDNFPGRTFRAATGRASMPAEAAVPITAIVGFSDQAVFQPRVRKAPATVRGGPATTVSAKTGNAFGYLTVADFASSYDVNPLYAGGMTGKGSTIGIMTLAAFKPSDAFAYWKALGLTVDPHRIRIVNVDGGPGLPSDASGSLETTLDVEQSGGIAPGAKIIVYQAPNTNQGFVDVFAAAIDANKADTLSISWGDWEWLHDIDNAPVVDPKDGKTVVASTTAIHELLLKASIQGQTVFAASGDGGAYDANDAFGCFGPYSPSVANSCSLTLSVDYPASDTLITAAGGTTLPGHQEYCLNAACTPPFYEVQIPKERVWGWDYLLGLCSRLGLDPITCGIFPAGSGGGVSVFFGAPPYQAGVPGIQVSQPGQAFHQQPYGLRFALPANFAGRNVPDVSFNADPETGYVVYYTSSVTGFSAEPLWGGTSFVSQQLSGVTALLNQYVGQRIGLLNVPLYRLASGEDDSSGNGPVNAITAGDNWFYRGSENYSPAAGLGTLDVYNFARYLSRVFAGGGSSQE